jgi:hypothetical protein
MELNFYDPPGYREAIAFIRETKRLAAIAAEEKKLAEEKARQQPKTKSIPRIKEPELASRFRVNSRVYLKIYTGEGFRWGGPYEVKSGIRAKDKLMKIIDPITKSQQFVSEHRLKQA